jgi:[ribosomal protein S18]-alanine N-acetyltransferase
VSDPLILRLATRDDADAIAELSRSEVEYGFQWRWTPTKVRTAIVDANTNVVVACSGAMLLGFGIMEYGEEHAHLSLFAVNPSARRRGIGRRMLSWLEDVALTAGISCVKLEARESNSAALAFYRGHGFRETETVIGMYRNVENGLRLERHLRKFVP